MQTTLVLACSGSKLDHAARAVDIYQGTLFKRGRAYAEAQGWRIVILSALHGFLDADTVIEPYNKRFTEQFRGPWREDLFGYYLGGQDYFGRAPDRLQPLIPSDRIGKMVFYMEQLSVIGRDELFRRHTKQRGLTEAIVDNLCKWSLTRDELLAGLNYEFGALPSFPDLVRTGLKAAAKTAGKTLHQNGDRFWMA